MAAQAVLLGFGDPMTLLSRGAEQGDWTITNAVLKRAAQIRQEMRSKELQVLAEAIGVEVGNRVGRQLARAFGGG